MKDEGKKIKHEKGEVCQGFMYGRRIVPVKPAVKKLTYKKLLKTYSGTGLEARKTAEAAYLLREMIKQGDTIWLGIAGIAIVEGWGKYVIELMKRGIVGAICTTGAQAYHDLHFADGLKVVQGHPNVNDAELRKNDVVRIYDAFIGGNDTLLAQDAIIRNFCLTLESGTELSSADFNCLLGKYILKNSKHPGRSFIAQAAKYKVPVFWDSGGNNSIALNLAWAYANGIRITISPNLDILESAAIVYSSKSTGYFELGGGGPKNLIQQTEPMISQIFGIDHGGADHGIEISMAIVNDGALSSCTLQEGISWGKYKAKARLVQIFGEYSVPFSLISGYVLENCKPRPRLKLMDKKEKMLKNLLRDRRRQN